MKRLFTTLLGLLFCISLSAQDKGTDFSKIIGEWAYSAPEAPYGQQEGTILVKQADGKLTADLNIQGSTLPIGEIKVDGNTYSSSFYVDGTSVYMSIVQKDNKLEGKVEAAGMIIPVFFKRVEKQK